MKKMLILIFLTTFLLTECNKSERLTSPDHYIIKSYITPNVKVNSPAEFSIEIIPTDGYKMEVEAPMTLKFDASRYPSIHFEKELYTKNDIKNIKKPVYKGRLIPQKEGEYSIKGDLSFVLCTSTICEPKKTEVTFNIVAQ